MHFSGFDSVTECNSTLSVTMGAGVKRLDVVGEKTLKKLVWAGAGAAGPGNGGRLTASE